jgi:hypothetical protein
LFSAASFPPSVSEFQLNATRNPSWWFGILLGTRSPLVHVKPVVALAVACECLSVGVTIGALGGFTLLVTLLSGGGGFTVLEDQSFCSWVL